MEDHNASRTTQRVNERQQPSGTSFNYSKEDIQDFLEQKNLQIVSKLAPTITYLLVIMVTGLVGNAIVFLVYYRRFKPSVVRTYILAMSVCDFLIIAFSIPMNILEIHLSVTFYSVSGCKISRTITMFLVSLSACILVAVAVSRQQTVCSMMPSSSYSVRSVYRAVLIGAVLCFVNAIPYGVLSGNRTRTFQGTNITGVMCTLSDQYYDSVFLFVYDVMLANSFAVCIIIMSVSYGRIVLHLWRHRKTATNTINKETSDSSTTISIISFKEIKNAGQVGYDTGTEQGTRPLTEVPRLRSVEEPRSVVLHTSKTTKQRPHHTKSREAEKAVIGTASRTVAGQNRQTSNHHTLADNESTSKMTKERPHQTDSSDADNIVMTEIDICSLAELYEHHPYRHGQAEVRSGSKTEEPTVIHMSSEEPTQSGNRLIDVGKMDIGANRCSLVSQEARKAATRTTPGRSINLGSEVQHIPSRTTFMLFVLTVVFVVNFLPYLVMEILDLLVFEAGKEQIDANLRYICLRSYYINSAVNPLVYCFCSCRFRHECRQLFRCKKT